MRARAATAGRTDDDITEGVRANDVFFSNSVLNEIRLGLPGKRTVGVALSHSF